MDINTEIFSAVKESNLDRIKRAIGSYERSSGSLEENGAPTNVKDGAERKSLNSLLNATHKEQNEDSTLLHIAVDRGHSSVVEHLLKNGANANASCTFKGQKNYTPLHLACEKEDDRSLRALLKYGAVVNANAGDNVTPLHVATKLKRTKNIEILLEHGVNVDYPDDDGKTALFLAVKKTNLSTVEAILKCQPNVNDENNAKSLIAAIRAYDPRFGNRSRENQEAIITCLVQYGFILKPHDLDSCRLLHKAINEGLFIVVEHFLQLAQVTSEFFEACLDEGGQTLLHTACKTNSLQNIGLVGQLLDKGAKIDAKRGKDGCTPLQLAVIKGCTEIVKLLLTRGANVDLQNQYGYTALSYAALFDQTDIVKMVLNRRPDINNKGNRRALHAAASEADVLYDTTETISSLYEYGFTANPDYIQDFKLAKLSVIGRHLLVIEEFLNYHGADFVKRFASTNNSLPLHLAAKCFRKDVVEMLVKYGLDVNARDPRGQTPIFHAVEAGAKLFQLVIGASSICEEIIEFLLQQGAHSDISDSDGKTPLHYVASCPDSLGNTAKLLLNYGADVNRRCHKGKTPFHAAIENRNSSVQFLFLNCIVPNFKNANHREILKVESERYGSPLLEASLDVGADINSVDEKGMTTLGWACDRGYMELVISLLEHGCDVREFMAMKLDDSIKDVLRTHITKLIVAGLKKSDVALYVPEGNSELVVECGKELQTMKRNIPHSAVSFCDVLTEDATRLATYARNESVVKFLKSYHCTQQFPLYWSVLRGFIWRGIVRKFLLGKSMIVFRSYGGIFHELPDVCVEHILHYFSDEDLRVFMQFNICKMIRTYNQYNDDE